MCTFPRNPYLIPDDTNVGSGPNSQRYGQLLFELLHETERGRQMQAVTSRVRQHRWKLRAEGLRPVQLWVPDTRSPEFAQECKRQSRLVAQSDMEDKELQEFLDQALEDVEGWV